jgi:hypothetical protein
MYGQMWQETVRHRRSRGANKISRGLEDRHGQQRLLIAKRRTVAGIFRFAARERSSISAFDRRAEFEIGAGSANIRSRSSGCFDQFVKGIVRKSEVGRSAIMILRY